MKGFLLFVFCFTISSSLFAQSTANYSFATNTTGSLAVDANGNAIDMSTGTTQLLTTSASQHGVVGSIITFPSNFEFYFQASRYNSFVVNSNGIIQPIQNIVRITGTTYTAGAGTAANGQRISALCADLATGSSGGIYGKLIGTAPNRCYVVEFRNMTLMFDGTNYTNDATYQVRFYETTGAIEYVYGAMNCSNITGSAADVTPEVGFSWGTGATQQLSVDIAASTKSTTTTMTQNTVAVGTITNLNSAADGSRRVYKFTPPTSPNPTGSLTFSSVAMSTMQLNWTNITGNIGYAIYVSTDNINYSYVTKTATNAVSYAASGLTNNTTYYWKVYAVTEGAISATPLSASQTTLLPSLTGTKTVGPTTADYPSITAAINDIKIKGLASNLSLELQTGYNTAYAASVETYPLAFPLFQTTSNANTVTIVPNSAVVAPIVLTSSAATPTVDLNGGTNIIFDGRNGGAGTNKYITIENTNTASQAIRFINDANNNTVKYCTVTGINTTAATTAGVILFSTTTGTTGNDNNTIDNCDIHGIGSNTPTMCINSSGTSTSIPIYNSGNTISNCNISDFYNSTSTLYGGEAIVLLAGSTDWNIIGNSFFQTVSRTTFASNTIFGGIYISNTNGNNFNITGNYFGGTAPNCGGTALTINTSLALQFRLFYISVGNGTATSIQGNTLQNITVSTGMTSSVMAMMSLVSGKINCGNITGNTLGSITGTGSISMNNSTTTANVLLSGISAGSGTAGNMNISNNNIGGITLTNSSTGSMSFRGISFAGTPGIYTISNNLIGSLITANSINNTTNSSTYGVYGGASGLGAPHVISNNTIANMANSSSGSSGQVVGIFTVGSGGGAYTIQSNIVRDLSSSAPNISTSGSSVALIGIASAAVTTPGQIVSGNTVYNLSNTANAATNLIGILYSGPNTGTNMVSKNLVHSISAVATSAIISGIYVVNTGVQTIQNNMVRLGLDINGNSLTTANSIYGIYEINGTNKFYNNSIYIGGTGVGTTASNSICLYSAVSATTRSYVNNIFVNARSNATTGGKHYAIRLTGLAAGSRNPNVSCNNNLYYVSGTGGVFGYTLSDRVSIVDWRGATSKDYNSGFANPNFTNATGSMVASPTAPPLKVSGTSPAEGSGISIASVTDDFEGDIRSSNTPNDIGADAGNYTANDVFPPVINYTALDNTTSTVNRAITGFATITDASSVNTTTGTKPRLYYRRSADANSFGDNGSTTTGWKYVEASNTSSPFDFTIDYSKLYKFSSPVGSGVAAAGDRIYYFIVAGDNATTSNVGMAYGGFAVAGGEPVSAALTSANFGIVGLNYDSYTIGAATTWTGATSTAWADGTNWNPNAVPTNADDAVIPSAGITNFPTVSTTQGINKLIINSGASVTVAGGNLQIGSVLSNSGTINATAGTVEFTGNTTQTIAANTFSTNTIQNLINSNATGLTLGGALNVTGTVSTGNVSNSVFASGGNLTLISNASGDARIADLTNAGVNSGNTITGNVKVQRYIPGGGSAFPVAGNSKRGFRFLSHPFSSSIALNQINAVGGVSISGVGGAANGFQATGTNNPSAFWYDATVTSGAGAGSNTVIGAGASAVADPGWKAFTSTNGSGSNAWLPGMGIRLLFRGDRSQGLLSSADYTMNAATPVFTGNVNTGLVTVNLTSDAANPAGYNLVGNPLPSPVDLSLVASNNIGANFYVFDPTIGNRGGYSAAKPFATSYVLPIGGAFIASVTSLGDPAAINFTEDSKAATATGSLFRIHTKDSYVKFRLEGANMFWDELNINFSDSYKPETDFVDGAKFINSDVNFYSIAKDQNRLSLDNRNLKDGETIPLGIITNQSRSFTIKATDINVEAGTSLYLIDKYLNTQTKLEAGTAYDFTTNSAAASQGEERFEIAMKQTSQVVLQPLVATSFSIKLSPNPAKDVVKVSFNNATQANTTISIVNAEGKTLKTINAGNVLNAQLNINVANFAKGSYYVLLNNGTITKTEKLVIQ